MEHSEENCYFCPDIKFTLIDLDANIIVTNEYCSLWLDNECSSLIAVIVAVRITGILLDVIIFIDDISATL